MHKSEIPGTGPRCLFAAELQMTDGQGCFLHSHACTEIVWYRGCAGHLLQGGERLPYRDGDVAVYQPPDEHGDDCRRGGAQLCAGISGGGADHLRPGIWRADQPTLQTLGRLRAELDRHDEWRQNRLDLLCGCLVLELRRQLDVHAPDSPREAWHVSAARRIFATRYAEPLAIAEVADELGINPDYLRQLFVKWTGEPPLRHLIRKRLEAACDLLRLNQESTGRIAARVGIANPAYFSRLFKSRYGVTPTAYRARYAARRDR